MNILAYFVIIVCLIEIGFRMGMSGKEREPYDIKDTWSAILTASVVIPLALRVLGII